MPEPTNFLQSSIVSINSTSGLSPEANLKAVSNAKWYHYLVVNEKTKQLEKKFFLKGIIESIREFWSGNTLRNKELIKFKALQLINSLENNWDDPSSKDLIKDVRALANATGLTADKTLNLDKVFDSDAVIKQVAGEALNQTDRIDMKKAFSNALETFVEKNLESLRDKKYPDHILEQQQKTEDVAQNAISQLSKSKQSPDTAQQTSKRTIRDEEGSTGRGTDPDASGEDFLNGDDDLNLDGGNTSDQDQLPQDSSASLLSVPESASSTTTSTSIETPFDSLQETAHQVEHITAKTKNRWPSLPKVIAAGFFFLLGGGTLYAMSRSTAPVPGTTPIPGPLVPHVNDSSTFSTISAFPTPFYSVANPAPAPFAVPLTPSFGSSSLINRNITVYLDDGEAASPIETATSSSEPEPQNPGALDQDVLSSDSANASAATVLPTPASDPIISPSPTPTQTPPSRTLFQRILSAAIPVFLLPAFGIGAAYKFGKSSDILDAEKNKAANPTTAFPGRPIVSSLVSKTRETYPKQGFNENPITMEKWIEQWKGNYRDVFSHASACYEVLSQTNLNSSSYDYGLYRLRCYENDMRTFIANSSYPDFRSDMDRVHLNKSYNTEGVSIVLMLSASAIEKRFKEQPELDTFPGFAQGLQYAICKYIGRCLQSLPESSVNFINQIVNLVGAPERLKKDGVLKERVLSFSKTNERLYFILALVEMLRRDNPDAEQGLHRLLEEYVKILKKRSDKGVDSAEVNKTLSEKKSEIIAVVKGDAIKTKFSDQKFTSDCITWLVTQFEKFEKLTFPNVPSRESSSSSDETKTRGRDEVALFRADASDSEDDSLRVKLPVRGGSNPFTSNTLSLTSASSGAFPPKRPDITATTEAKADGVQAWPSHEGNPEERMQELLDSWSPTSPQTYLMFVKSTHPLDLTSLRLKKLTLRAIQSGGFPILEQLPVEWAEANSAIRPIMLLGWMIKYFKDNQEGIREDQFTLSLFLDAIQGGLSNSNASISKKLMSEIDRTNEDEESDCFFSVAFSLLEKADFRALNSYEEDEYLNEVMREKTIKSSQCEKRAEKYCNNWGRIYS